jgi:repressor LexA
MHLVQKKILDVLDGRDQFETSLRDLGRLVGVEHPQMIKHHLLRLQGAGFLKLTISKGGIMAKKVVDSKKESLVSIPIFGAANCGSATFFAEECLVGYLHASAKLLPKNRKGIFALRAVGSSMNRADIDGKSIEDGDYVLARKDLPAISGDYIVSLVDNMANIKRLLVDKQNHQIVLVSESADDLPPIIIHEQDFADFEVNAKIVGVLKKPKI